MANDEKQVQEQEAAPKRKVFDAAQIATLGNVVPRKWVRVPEWDNAEVCVWGTDLNAQKNINQDTRICGDDMDEAAKRRIIATIIETCKDGDGDDAKPIFVREQHWKWLERQPASVLNNLMNTVQELDMSGGLRAQEIIDFFAMTEALGDCLTSIASACGACTDYLANCQETSPPLRLVWLCTQIASSLSASTPGSARSAQSA